MLPIKLKDIAYYKLLKHEVACYLKEHGYDVYLDQKYTIEKVLEE